MRILITGANGQLGQALRAILQARGDTVIPTDVPEFDITNPEIVNTLAGFGPDVMIHCAAMTNVDGCAKDPDLAFKINAFGTQNVAHACMRCNADMVAVSTNEVFDGTATQPYPEDSATNPINPYGSSKRAGEQMAARYIKDKLYIVRTAWIYAAGGNNFPAKIMAGADKHGEVRVVTDEVANPTYAPDLAAAIVDLIQTRAYNIYHFTNAGHCSRFDFAQEILRQSGRAHIPLQPITLAEYPRPSTVPPFAPLANLNGAKVGIELRPWPEALQAYLSQADN